MRICSGCGKTYLRVNIVDVWTIRCPGKRMGWRKERLRLCNRCCSQRQATRMLTTANIPPTVQQAVATAGRYRRNTP